MTYVFDLSSFLVLGHYFPEPFASFWRRFDELLQAGRIVSVREVYRELDAQAARPHLRDWMRHNRHIFTIPSSAETAFVAEIFSVRHFQQLIAHKQRMKGGPAADPFVIASARVRHGCVVTEERLKENAARIPNVCAHFGIDCTNVEGLMAREGWVF